MGEKPIKADPETPMPRVLFQTLLGETFSFYRIPATEPQLRHLTALPTAKKAPSIDNTVADAERPRLSIVPNLDDREQYEHEPVPTEDYVEMTIITPVKPAEPERRYGMSLDELKATYYASQKRKTEAARTIDDDLDFSDLEVPSLIPPPADGETSCVEQLDEDFRAHEREIVAAFKREQAARNSELMSEYFHDWLERGEEATKDPKYAPLFDEEFLLP